MSDSESSSEYDGMDPDGYDVVHKGMAKMVKKFKENNAEDQLAQELDSIVYGSKLVSRDQLQNTKLRSKPEDSGSEDIDPEELGSSGGSEDLQNLRRSNKQNDDEELESDEIEEVEDYEDEEDQNVQTKLRKIDEKYYEESDENEDDEGIMDQLDKIEKQDTGYKEKVMEQNKEDAEKAKIVKEQRKLVEGVIAQRMAIQGIISKVNQLPQSSCYKYFEERKAEEISELKSTLKQNLINLNDVWVLLGKRININIPWIEDNSNIYKILDSNYEKLTPTWEELVQKWYSRAQVNSSLLNKKLNKKNVALSTLQQPILTQVYKTLENKQLIETRSHQKREVFRILGKPLDSMDEKLDFQIYDDRDFYQGLIKDMLNGTAESVDLQQVLAEGDNTMSLTQEYLRKREKMKKFIEKKKKSNKISKDKKLKYIIHDKLVNFMVPQEEELLAKGREDILKILFGWTANEVQDKSQDNSIKAGPFKSEKKKQKVDDDEDLGMRII